VSNYVYDKVNEKIKSKEITKLDKFELRNQFVTKKGNKLSNEELKVHKEIRTGAIFDLVCAYKECYKRVKSKTITHFEIKNRSGIKKCIRVPKSGLKIVEYIENDKIKRYLSLCPTKSGIKAKNEQNQASIRLSNDKCLKTLKIEHDSHILREYNRWYLVVPIKAEAKYNKDRSKICSMDPG